MTTIEEFFVGRKVEVVHQADETLPKRFLGQQGTILGYDYCSGVGQSEDDPLILVDFGSEDYAFWGEELEIVKVELQ